MEDIYVRYCLDQAVATLGTTIEGELGAVKGKNEGQLKRGQEAVLAKYLGTKRNFRNPTPTTGKGVK